MPIDLYYTPASPPCRAVLLAAAAIGVELNLKEMDLSVKNDHLKPEFLQINPQHTVPTIDDDGFILYESRAIMTYLQDQYGKSDSLYSRDPKKRALIDQRLYFDIGILGARLFEYSHSKAPSGQGPDPDKLEKLKEAVKLLNTFLEKSEYAAGSKLTLADLTLVANISTLDVAGIDLSPYKNVQKWYKKVKETAPGYEEANEKNLLILKEIIEKLKAQSAPK